MNSINKTVENDRIFCPRTDSKTPSCIVNSWYEIVALILLFTAACILIPPVNAFATPESIVESENVYISGVTLDPAVFFTGDQGTATLFVTNGNANQSVTFNHVTFGDSMEIRRTSGSYDATASIGPLQTRTFIFSVATDADEGSYYPTFSLSFRDAGSLYYRTPVKVDNTPLILSVIEKPDTFAKERKDTLTVQIANPRKNDLKNVILDVSGPGITILPSQKYIGSLPSGNATTFVFTVTPKFGTTLNVSATYDNGDNHHHSEMAIPVVFDTDKKQASPKISNLKVNLENGVYHVTGDVTNAGLTTANGVTVTSLPPALPLDPYKSYVIGALKADDFGSFEVSFRAEGSVMVPLEISYKDADGNIITSRQDISIGGIPDTGENNQGGMPIILLLAALVIAAVGGWYFYQRRRKSQ